jgi:hypothetical protein
LDQSYRYGDDGKDEQNVNESAEGVGTHHPERPEQYKNDRNSPKHG